MTKAKLRKATPKIGAFLDDEEKAIYEAIESDDYVPVSLLTPELRAEYQMIARATMNEGRVKISLRLPESDLERLKAKAMREGMPYQTLIGSILHKAVS
jgi:CopG antitoxin of type II toxin-antitoxin system